MTKATCYSGGKKIKVVKAENDQIEYDDTGFNLTVDGEIKFVWVGSFSLELEDE